MIAAVLAAAVLSATPAPRHPGLAPGPRLLAADGKAAGPRVKPGVTDKQGGQRADAVDAVARRYGLAGEVLVARGDRVLLDRGYGPIAPGGGALHRAGERWRLASITKQVTAALVVRHYALHASTPEVTVSPAKALDLPLAELNSWGGAIPMRAYLQHHTGLANPDVTPADGSGVPFFYRAAQPDLGYCRSKPTVPGSAFSYNNCDYLIAAQTVGPLSWPAGLAMARPGEKGVPGFVHGKPEPRFDLGSWGAAGGLMGTARAVFSFDRSLVTGKLLPPAALAELWKPEGHGSYQALGQWVFPGKLAGCAVPKRIVQRDGEIWGVQARNFILPDDDLAVVVFTNRSADDFAIGEVWEGKGFAYDLLSAAVGC